MSTLRPRLLNSAAPVILGLGLLLSVWLSRQAALNARAADEVYLRRLHERLVEQIHNHLQRYEYGLHGARSLWPASLTVHRANFAAMVGSRDLAREFPGSLGLGFIRRVDRADLAAFLTATRADQAPDFQLKTSGTANDLFIVEFIEPVAANQTQLGFDMGKDPQNREAATRAMLTGQTALTHPLPLMQAPNEGPGFYIFYPIYKNAPPGPTQQASRDTLLGWVYMPILAKRIFKEIAREVGNEISFQVFDGQTPNPSQLIYDGVPTPHPTPGSSQLSLSHTSTLSIDGMTWTITYGAGGNFPAASRFGLYSVAIAGPLITLLISALILSLRRTLHHAQALALTMTADLAAAKRKSELLAMVATHTTNAVILTDRGNRITWINQGFTRLTGYDEAAALGHEPDPLLVSPLAKVASRTALHDAIDQSHGFRGEVLIRSKDGRDHWVDLDLVPMHDSEGRLTGYMRVHLDITTRKDAEDKLREKEERLALATLHNGIGIWDWNLLNHNMIWDDSMFALYHIRREDFVGTEEAWRKSLHPDDLIRGDQEISDAIAGKKPFDTIFRIIWPNGEIRHIKAVAKVFYNEQGVPTRMLGTNWDITSRMRAEAKIHDLNSELEQRVAERTAELKTAATKLEAVNKELEAFSYSVSHDLRAPLRAIDGYARMAIEDFAPQLDETGRRQLNVIRDEAQRMSRLIDDLLTFSRISRQQTEATPIDMQSMAQEVYKEVLNLEPGRNVQFDLKPLPPAVGTPAMIRQVWVNLLSNALKFTRKRAAACIEVGAQQDAAGGWVYHVKDNGAGFDMRHADKLFGVFQRLHNQPDFEGTGVGLALVHRILERHGGRIWAEAAVDQGACFYFSLPSSTTAGPTGH
jgi:PAS domain S-box-containing protein